MAYGLLLYHHYDTGKIEIWGDNYVGSSYKIKALTQAPRFNALDGSVAKIEETIIKSTCQFSFLDQDEYDYNNLFTSNATKYLVKLYAKSGASSYTQIWAGYLTPDSYITTLEYQPEITLIARDNLGLLADLDFDLTDEYSTPASLITTMQEKISWQMNPIDWICQQYKSGTTYVKDAVISLLKWYDGDTHTWEEVILDILSSLGQQLRYTGAMQFSIVNIADINDMSNSSINVDYAIANAMSMEIIPSWKKHELSQDYGKYSGYPTRSVLSESHLSFYDKTTEHENTFPGWDWVYDKYFINTSSTTWLNEFGSGGGAGVTGLNPWKYKMVTYLFNNSDTDQQTTDKANKMEANAVECPKEYLYMFPYTSVAVANPDYIMRQVYITSGVGLSIVFKLMTARWRMIEKRSDRNVKLLVADTWTNTWWNLMSVSIGFISDDNVGYQMTENGWEQSSNINIIDFSDQSVANGIDSTTEFTVNIASFPCYPGTLIIRLHTMSGSGYVTEQLNIFKSIELKYPDNPSGIDLIGALNQDANSVGQKSLTYGEVPSECGDRLAYANGLFDLTQYHYALKNWVRNDGKSSSVQTLTELIARGEAHHYTCFTNNGEMTGGKMLRGTIPFTSVADISKKMVVRNENYILMYCQYDVLHNQANVILRQVKPYEHKGSFVYSATPVSSGGTNVISTGTNTELSWQISDIESLNKKRAYELSQAVSYTPASTWLLVDDSSWANAQKIALSTILDNALTTDQKYLLNQLLALTSSNQIYVYWNGIQKKFMPFTPKQTTFVSNGTSVGEVIGFDGGSTTIEVGGSGGASALSELSDVSLSAVANNQVLFHNGSEWINKPKAELGFASSTHTHTKSQITDLGNVAMQGDMNNLISFGNEFNFVNGNSANNIWINYRGSSAQISNYNIANGNGALSKLTASAFSVAGTSADNLILANGNGSIAQADLIVGGQLTRKGIAIGSSASQYGWYRVYDLGTSSFSSAILHMNRNYYNHPNEAYIVSIVCADGGSISVTQLSGVIMSSDYQYIQQIRVVSSGGHRYVDVLCGKSYSVYDNYYFSISGVEGCIVLTPTLISTEPSSSDILKTFTLGNGIISDRGYKVEGNTNPRDILMADGSIVNVENITVGSATNASNAGNASYAQKIGTMSSHPAIGDSTHPVYVDNEGQIQRCSSISGNAEFNLNYTDKEGTEHNYQYTPGGNNITASIDSRLAVEELTNYNSSIGEKRNGSVLTWSSRNNAWYADWGSLTTSDRNLKVDIEELDTEKALQFVKDNAAYEYAFNDNPEDKWLGFMAQDFQKDYPNSVRERSGNLKLDYNATIAVLFSAVKELTKKVEALETELNGSVITKKKLI